MATLKSIKNKYLQNSDGDALGVATNTENISTLGFKLATSDSLTKFNMKDGFVDDFQDATGIDSSGSTNETRDSSGKYFSGSGSAPANATGGTITTSGGNTIHTFNTAGNGSSTNDFVVPGGSASVTYLIVGGGGSGGSAYGGGGGGGGFRTGSFTLGSGSTSATTYTISAGAGGTAAAYPGAGGAGSNSTFNSITAYGGGRGAARPTTTTGGSGGSGGGGSDSGSGGSVSDPGYGFAGGNGPGNYGGGGGGAAGAGSNGAPNVPGTGGNGAASSITGSSVTYAGGGGGGSASSSVNGAAGGSGGGGAGGKGLSPADGNPGPTGSRGVPGTDGLGAGGGGGGYDNGGDGGNGVVIASYTTNAFTSTQYLDMTLQSAAYTAQAAPTTARVVLDELTVSGATTLNTDLKAYASRDNGTTYSQVTLADQGYLNANAGIDGYTKLMLHCNGSNDGTTFTDSSFSGHTVTASGNAVTSTTTQKFGTASYKAPATGDFLSIADSTDWAFGSDDFTIDAWLYRTGTSAYQTILQHKTDNSNYWQWRYFGGTGNFDFTVTGAGAFSVNWTVSAFAQDTWVHHQIVRNGNSWYLFQNGTQVGGTQTQAAAVPDMTGNLILQGDSSLGQPFVGYMDEIRISKGIARNTSNFVVPSNEYSQSRRLLSGSVDISGQPSGTNMKYKLETLNQGSSKQTRVYGASMAWA